MISKILRYIFTLVVLAVVAYIFIKPEPMESMIKFKKEPRAEVNKADTVTLEADSTALDTLQCDSLMQPIVDTLTTKK